MRRMKEEADDERVCGYWRASRVPAAAVIPAPMVSMVNAAVKMSVVE
jgi:hypothetical protein